MPIRRNQALITIDGVRELLNGAEEFEVRYDLVERGESGKPIYNCVYIFDGREHILISTRTTPTGIKERKLSIYPGLLNHHVEFGGGRDLVFHPDWTISVNGVRGRNDLLEGRSD